MSQYLVVVSVSLLVESFMPCIACFMVSTAPLATASTCSFKLAAVTVAQASTSAAKAVISSLRVSIWLSICEETASAMVWGPSSKLPSASMKATVQMAFVLALLALMVGNIEIWKRALASSSAMEAPPGAVSMFTSKKDVPLAVPVISWPGSSIMASLSHFGLHLGCFEWSSWGLEWWPCQ